MKRLVLFVCRLGTTDSVVTRRRRHDCRPHSPGTYVITSAPVAGHPGTPEPVELTVAAGEVVDIVLLHDTGRR